MRKINFENQSLDFHNEQSALEAIEQQGFSIPSRCRQGNCHSCVLHCDEFEPHHSSPINAPEFSVYGLGEEQKSMGLFLSCQCQGSELPTHAVLNIQLAKLNMNSASVIEKKSLNSRVFSIKFTSNLTWQAGQFINIHTPHGERSYSIASIPEEGVIELHISKIPNGVVSNYLFKHAKVGGKFTISNANGECFYHPLINDKPLLLIGTGSGLAPLVGILKQAIKSKHKHDIHLYIAQGEPEFHYYQKQLNRLEKKHDQVFIHYICRRNTKRINIESELGYTMRIGELEDMIKQDFNNLQPFGAFICGAPKMVRNMQIQCIRSKMDRNNIRIDAFEDSQ